MKLLAKVLLLLFMGASLPAALVINASDVASNHYLYDLNYSEMANSTIFNADVFSQQNVFLGTGSRSYISPTGGMLDTTHAEFVYKFDFTAAGYQATSVKFGEAFYDNAGADLITTTAEYSIDDGATWNLIRRSYQGSFTTATTGTGTDNNHKAGRQDFPLAAASVVLYRVKFELAANDPDHKVTTANLNQWGRCGNPGPYTAQMGTDGFDADFTLTATPEPATLILLSLGSLFLVRKRK